MKRFLCLLLAALLVPALSACAAAPAAGLYDVDLTALNSTMVYAEVFQMLNVPENYLGKTVKMEGTFSVYEGEGRNYYACVIQDATACCAQGIEFVTAQPLRYPEDYPALGTNITVTGVYDVYQEDGWDYCQLVDAVLDY